MSESFRTPRGRVITRNISTRVGTDEDGPFVAAYLPSVRVSARWWGGEYIELRSGYLGEAFYVLNVSDFQDRELSEAFVADRLWTFVRDEYENLLAYRRDHALN